MGDCRIAKNNPSKVNLEILGKTWVFLPDRWDLKSNKKSQKNHTGQLIPRAVS